MVGWSGGSGWRRGGVSMCCLRATRGGESVHIYPGSIDGLAFWGSPDAKEYKKAPDDPGTPSYKRAGIQPQRHPARYLDVEDTSLIKAQKHGFTTAALALEGQMLPGQV